jgi:hypothetical protein
MPVSVIDILTSAPAPSLTDDPLLFNRADLPAVGANVATSDIGRAERLYREALAMAQANPNYYSSTPAAQQAITEFSISDYWFWKDNFPKVELLAKDNQGVSQAYLNTPWNNVNGLAPIIIMEVTPRKKPIPAVPLWTTVIGYVAKVVSFIPTIGTVVSMAMKMAAASGVRSWANSIATDTDYSTIHGIFAPQYYPRMIQVPMPLDRAQLIVAQPVYAVPMIAQFIDEVRSNTNPQLADIPVTPDLGNQLVSGNVTIGQAANGTALNSGSALAPLAIGGAIVAAILLLKGHK